MAYYSAALVCFLTACIRVLPFRTIDEFVEDGTFKLIVPRGSADYDILAVSVHPSLSLFAFRAFSESRWIVARDRDNVQLRSRFNIRFCRASLSLVSSSN